MDKDKTYHPFFVGFFRDEKPVNKDNTENREISETFPDENEDPTKKIATRS